MTRLGDLLREGAADLLGWDEEREQLSEAALEGRMMARELENIGWVGLDGVGIIDNYFEPTREAREKQIERAYRYFFNDPIIKQGVKVKARYVYGKGIATPRYRHEHRPDEGKQKQGDNGAGEGLAEQEALGAGANGRPPSANGRPPEEVQADELIKRFWLDPENQKCLTGHTAQREKEEELTIQGNVFFALYRQEGEAPPTVIGAHGKDVYEPPTLKLADLRMREIVEIITHPGNRKIPVYYKRVYRARVFTFDGVAGDLTYGVYEQSHAQPQVRYYRDWRFKAPTEWPEGSGKYWGPKQEQIVDDAVIYHVKVNATSDMRFGLTELQSALKWSQGLGQYMSNRMQVAQALAALAMQAKVKGGPQHREQVKQALSDISRVAGEVPGTETLNLSRADVGRTKITVGSEGARLEPMVTDTGASGAQIDTTIFKGQIAAALGVPVTHLGESGQANLATATSMDAPLLRMCEDRQELWEEALKDIIGYMLEGSEGLDPHRVEVQMPPILQRDVNAASSMLLSLMAGLDPNGSNRQLMRFVLGEVLDAMGKTNTKELLDQILPEGFQTPHQQAQEEALHQAQLGAAAAAAGAPGPSGAAPPHANVQRAIQQASRQARGISAGAETAENEGRRRGGNRPGGPGAAIAESGNRAMARRERALSPQEAAYINAALSSIEDEGLREAAWGAMASLNEWVDEPEDELVGADT
jgi:hypothetical protein